MQAASNSRLPLVLLMGQAFCFGAALFTAYTTSSALFLVDYSAQTMPYVNIVTGIVMVSASLGFAHLQKRLPLAQAAFITVAALTGLYFATWVGYIWSWGRWLSFGGMILYQVLVLLGDIVLSAQAGQLFNVREIKRLLPFVLAVQALVSPLGSLLMPAMLAVLGRIEHIILVTCAILFGFLVLLWVTSRHFAPVLAQTKQPAERQPALSLLRLLQKPYIALLFCSFTLAIVGYHLLRFVNLHQISIHFTTPAALAAFFSTLFGVTVFTSFLFSMLVVGHVLTRFGLRIGLAANPTLLILLLVIGVGVGFVWGPTSSLFLWLTVGALSTRSVVDKLSAVALKTSYQALPAAERVSMQAAVEGLGTPVGFVVAGLLLLLFGALPGVTDVHIMLLVLILAGLWLAAGLWTYRHYAATLVQTLSRRALGAVELTLADAASLAVVEQFLRSQKLHEVRLALDLLEQSEHPTLAAQLARLVTQAPVEVQVEALHRIARQRVTAALPAVEACLTADPPPTVKGAALAALCALREGEAVEAVLPYLNDPEPSVRQGALVGLLRDGGIAGILVAGEQLMALVASPDPAQRIWGATVLAAVGAPAFYQPLLTLLADEHLAVRQEALVAAQHAPHERLLPSLMAGLDHSATRSAAVAALLASGELLRPLADQALAGETALRPATVRRLVRICGQSQGEWAIACLKPHLDHPDGDQQHQVLLALQRRGYRAQGEEVAHVDAALHGCARQGLRLLMARQEIGEGAAVVPLQRALCEELAGVCQRTLLLLGLLYDPRALQRAGERLLRGASHEQALALEMLEVTLAAERKAWVLPLVDETLPLARRIALLNQHFALPHLEREARLAEMISETTTWRQDWTRACAIYAAAQLGLCALTEAITQTQTAHGPLIPETAAWALPLLSGRSESGTDSGPQPPPLPIPVGAMSPSVQ